PFAKIMGPQGDDAVAEKPAASVFYLRRLKPPHYPSVAGLKAGIWVTQAGLHPVVRRRNMERLCGVRVTVLRVCIDPDQENINAIRQHRSLAARWGAMYGRGGRALMLIHPLPRFPFSSVRGWFWGPGQNKSAPRSRAPGANFPRTISR